MAYEIFDGTNMVRQLFGRRCRKGVDPVLDGYPKLIAIDEEADHQIVYGRRCGKAPIIVISPNIVTAQPASSSFCRSRLLVSFWGRDKGVAIKSLSDGFKDIFGMLARGGDIPANATESLGPLKRAKPT